MSVYYFVVLSLTTLCIANVSSESTSDKYPQIKEGDPCTPGAIYKVDCNTCRCGSNGALLCSKMACLKNDKPIPILRSMNDDEEYKGKPADGKCEPGEVFNEVASCEWCFCNYLGELNCFKKPDGCDSKLLSSAPASPVDLDPSLADENIVLPNLPHASAKCTPGKSYQVLCNRCICKKSGNLICEKRLCLSFTDAHDVDAEKLTGTPCNTGENINYNCIQCKCNKEHKMDCEAIDDCKTKAEEDLERRYRNKKMSMDIKDVKKEDCIPLAVYRMDCNKCYCQPDKTLRCTQLTCLNYSETKNVEKMRAQIDDNDNGL